MPTKSYRPICLILLLAIAFTASALHPYGHDFHDTPSVECQVCLHHAASPLIAGDPSLVLPEPVFRNAGSLVTEADRYAGATPPTPRARGPPLSI